eukprot:TRINITY_DN40880_c0_g1_i1.p1 TRINITY_DN40880_c0_g1~~TRINITY_DN40880_c0_g1_i1.p1  ORF type:complete len:416 (+),score=59.62 TRINITY_DN40880_c0_g1_i1:195-1442(+)
MGEDKTLSTRSRSPPPCTDAAADDETLPIAVLVGTYTSVHGHVNGKGQGIYELGLFPDGATLVGGELVQECEDPTYLFVGAYCRSIYAVCERAPGPTTQDSVRGFERRMFTGAWKFGANMKSISCADPGGFSACHLSLDPSGKFLAVANYDSGVASVAVFEVGNGAGEVGQRVAVVDHALGREARLPGRVVERQDGPHAHMVLFSGKNALLVADLGLDSVMQYTFSDGQVTPAGEVALPPGSGPRHIALHPNGAMAYVLCELNSTIVPFAVDQATGLLKPEPVYTPVSTLPTHVPAEILASNSTAAIRMHPSGNFVYASNRGHNSVAVLKVSGTDGEALELVDCTQTNGSNPRDFCFVGSNLLLAANQDSDSVFVFHVNQDTGILTPTGASASVPSPACLCPLPCPGREEQHRLQ